MAGGISLGQVLQVISGVPLRKVGSAKFENLHLPKRLEGSGIGGLIKQAMLDGGLQNIAQNPLQAITSQLQGGIGQAVAQLQAAASSVPGLDLAVQALTGTGGLAAAVTGFIASGNNLVGLTGGGVGRHAMQGHEVLTSMLGADTPDALSLARVAAPFAPGGAGNALVSAAVPALATAAAATAAGTMPVLDFVAWAADQAAALNTVVQASADALDQGQAAMALVSSVAATAGALMDFPGAREVSGFQALLRSTIQPEALAAMDGGIAAAKKEATDRVAEAIDQITSLED